MDEVSSLVRRITAKSLKMLAAKPRALIVIVMHLGEHSTATINDLLLECKNFGLKCNILSKVLMELTYLGIVEEIGSKEYRLSVYGEEIYSALRGIMAEVEAFIQKTLLGSIEEEDVLSIISIIVASLVGIIEFNDSEYEEIVTSIHAYISQVIINTVMELAKLRPYLRILLVSKLIGETNISDNEIY